MLVEELLEDVDFEEIRGDTRNLQIEQIAYDSRQVRPGALFCCLPGTESDGHRFARQAVDAGAVALLAEHAVDVEVPQVLVAGQCARPAMARIACAFEGHPARSLTTIGVTGTNGKTTTTLLLEKIFESAARRASVIGTLSGSRTTPESPDLQHLLARALEQGDDTVAMEVSSHALSQHRVDGFRMSAAVFTNLGRDHLDYHGTVEAYFDAKAALFTPDHCAVGVVNSADPWGRRLTEISAVPMVPYSIEEVSEVRTSWQGTRFRWRGTDFEIPLPGSFHVENALAAAATAMALGLDEEHVFAGLRRADKVPGRFELVEAQAPFTVVVDYAHTPDALHAALTSARDLAGDGRVLCVFGCGGRRDAEKRPEMGSIAEEGADLIFVTGDNPRDEDPLHIIEEISGGLSRPQGAVLEPDRRKAIEVAISTAKPGDVVLIAGKGHERFIEIGGSEIPFDDRAEAAAAIARIWGEEAGYEPDGETSREGSQ